MSIFLGLFCAVLMASVLPKRVSASGSSGTPNTLHWAKRSVTIHIQQDANWSPDLEETAIEGFWQWGPYLGREGVPRLVWTDSDKADILVHFVSRSGLKGNEIGRTRWAYDADGQVSSAEIQLAYDPPAQAASKAHQTSVAAHELGHALGLVEHSDNPSDLMFYASGTNSLDIHALRRLHDIYAR